jgi:hypothetical protein
MKHQLLNPSPNPSLSVYRTFVCRTLIAVSCIVSGHHVMAIEQPNYEVLQTDNAFQLRQYPSLLIAETFVNGAMDDASNQGFRVIANFIFGNNQVNNRANPVDGTAATALTTTEKSAKIAMTTPVTIEPAHTEKISMTAPVTVEPSPTSSGTMTDAKRWRVQFVMPKQYTLATLPKPNNPEVLIREVPTATYAVLTYSGFNFVSSVQSRTDELLSWIKAQGLHTIGTPQLARYNPPWTLPLWRRNEVMIAVERIEPKPSH